MNLGDDAAWIDDHAGGCEDLQAPADRREDVVKRLADPHGGHGLPGPHPGPVLDEPVLQDAFGQHSRGPQILGDTRTSGIAGLPC
ncbi:hypothetical protein [Methylobacterium goesingense]|uniref:Uncharacterized protein n=1 Tax=Methylobacterium goesingense TaxID=243690 RepID=A0ABV2LC38_9HYPH|nr:hypothetical protein [Methylobacterium goesingense]GJD76355.1 hypothetical protein CFIICLFH_4611 [Methylobacterium goesingense]